MKHISKRLIPNMHRIRLLLLLAVCSTDLAAAEWINMPAMPTARQEIYVAVAAGIIYVPGGILADGLAFTSAFEAYDTKQNTWDKLAPVPAARHHITPAIVGDKLYAIGGFEGGFPDWVMQNDVFVYDLQKKVWTAGVAMPEPQAEHVIAVVAGKIHIIGGRVPQGPEAKHFDQHVDTTMHRVFNPETGLWFEAKPAPTARNSAAAVVINDLIYVVGGRNNIRRDDGSQIQQNIASLEVYNAETDTWVTRAPMPSAQGGLAAATLAGKLYVFGGEQWKPEHRVFAKSWVYDPDLDYWQALPDLPTARHGLAAATDEEAIYVLGGCTQVGGGAAVATLEAIKP